MFITVYDPCFWMPPTDAKIFPFDNGCGYTLEWCMTDLASEEKEDYFIQQKFDSYDKLLFFNSYNDKFQLLSCSNADKYINCYDEDGYWICLNVPQLNNF